MHRRLLVVVLTCAVALVGAAQQRPAVRVWQGTIELPTYQEGPANPNPPFDLFIFGGRFNYPYPLRDALGDTRELVTWRSLHLENEYLRLTVLPDLGGHIYSCVDKRTGQDMFYANKSIKKALIGYRGAWAAFGVEFNFPVSHNWMSMSPVDFATVQNDDGSGSVWVGNTDQVYRMRWRVELRLQPATTALQQNVELYNASDVRHRYYWWTNGAVQAWDDSRLIYPTNFMATHGFTSIEPWPIDRKGHDLSLIRNQTDGPVSLFTYGTREPWVGVYHPHTNSGTVHVADPAELPTHKVWSWGYDRDALAWREALSDDNSAYVELQAGLFRNQETYAFLEPQESVRFTEYWLPVRDLGGISRANTDAVVHMDRRPDGIAVDVTRTVPNAQITIRQLLKTLDERRMTLSPATVWTVQLPKLSLDPVEVEVRDDRGNTLILFKEKALDLTPPARVRTGAQRNVRPSRATAKSADEFVAAATLDELEGRLLGAMETYQMGLRQFPDAFVLLKAAGRLAVALGWADATHAVASRLPIEWLQKAQSQNTTDFEVAYYLGIALAAARRAAEARPHLESARRFQAFQVSATLALARLSPGEPALALIRGLGAKGERATAIGGVEVTTLRRLGRQDEARDRLRQWRRIDPTESILRNEMVLLGESDSALWTHLAADANRVLDVVDHYAVMGANDDAVTVLDRDYPRVDPPLREPGAVAPQDSPLIAYEQAYRRRASAEGITAAFAHAPTLPLAYVFPNRRSSWGALDAALMHSLGKPDRVAQFLSASLFLSSGLVEPAIGEWQQVREAKAKIPTLHRNLGLALLHGKGDVAEARAVLTEGTIADPENVEVYLALDGVLSASDATPSERVAALRRFPSLDRSRSALIFKLALALAEAGQADEAERLFHDRFFPREEGGTNVRAVYAQVHLTSARLAAEAKNCQAALAILDALPAERPKLLFTRGTLADALQPATMARQVAAIEEMCGRASAAKARWARLEVPFSSGGAPLALAIADQARSRVTKTRTAEQRKHLEDALASATATLESGGTSNLGSVEYARGLLLAALGRTKEARQSLRRVFVLPDRNLSHALARAALREL